MNTQQSAARAAAARRSGAKSSSKSPSKQGGSDFGFMTSETPGFKVQPKSVLIISLIYMGIVVFLHIIGKMRSTGAAAPETTA